MTRPGTARLSVCEPAEPADAIGAALGAHLLGQAGARRGLRGGEPVLKGARAAYLSAQWRGADDRRPATGLLHRLEA